MAPQLIGGGRAFFTEEDLAAFPGEKDADVGIEYGDFVLLVEGVNPQPWGNISHFGVGPDTVNPIFGYFWADRDLTWLLASAGAGRPAVYLFFLAGRWPPRQLAVTVMVLADPAAEVAWRAAVA
jgi:hypothetical protein